MSVYGLYNGGSMFDARWNNRNRLNRREGVAKRLDEFCILRFGNMKFSEQVKH